MILTKFTSNIPARITADKLGGELRAVNISSYIGCGKTTRDLILTTTSADSVAGKLALDGSGDIVTVSPYVFIKSGSALTGAEVAAAQTIIEAHTPDDL